MSIPDGLKIQQRGKDPGHYEVLPADSMTLEKYIELLDQVVLRSLEPSG